MFETRFWQLKTWATSFNYEQIFSLSTMCSIAAMIQAIADPVNWAKVLNLAWLGKVVHDLQLFASSSMFCATSTSMFYRDIHNSCYYLAKNKNTADYNSRYKNLALFTKQKQCMMVGKEVQIVYRLFLVNCYLREVEWLIYLAGIGLTVHSVD